MIHSLKKDLPLELRKMVSDSVMLLGDLICRELGPHGYRSIEAVRRRMVTLREASTSISYEKLNQTFLFFRKLSHKEQIDLAHSYTLMLELMNACENAYRTFRNQDLRFNQSQILKKVPHPPKRIVYVLTAHPTEARSPLNIQVFHWIQEILTDAFRNSFEFEKVRLKHALELAWKVPIVRSNKPSVLDEAESIYTILLSEEVLSTLIEFSEAGVPVLIRSWVGGDKDGHPGVDEQALLGSLQTSRHLILKWIQERLKKVEKTIQFLKDHSWVVRCHKQKQSLLGIETLRPGDGRRVHVLKKQLIQFREDYQKWMGADHPELKQIAGLLQLFPGFVVPLELRESSDVLMKAKQSSRQAIVRMLRSIKGVAKGGEPTWYARGLIISMASSMEHLSAAADVMTQVMGELYLPIIPLFEEPESLKKSKNLIDRVLKTPRFRNAIKKYWNSSLEIMLGYSDSAKEGGVLPSRVEIAQAMLQLDRVIRKAAIYPIFFHGSGGSVDRGGGSIRDQISWWPSSALENYKATIQGEMVERSFASPQIVLSQLNHLVQTAGELLGEKKKPEVSEDLIRFSQRVTKEYVNKIESPGFFDLVEKATPYPYLSVLKIGSRPSKRKPDVLSIRSLRAIPWVLCWTQTRILFPTWWGVGTAWNSLSSRQKVKLKKAFHQDPIFTSYVKALGFTLAKVELSVWKLYLTQSQLEPGRVSDVFREFEKEYRFALDLVKKVSGSSLLLKDKPWLRASIYLRSAMIHPLNLLQIIAFENRDSDLIRLTVTGIASGMLTTG